MVRLVEGGGHVVSPRAQLVWLQPCYIL